METRLLILALLIATSATAQPNKVAHLQTTDSQPIGCNFALPIASVVSVTMSLEFGTDANPAGMVSGAPVIGDGTFQGSTVTNGKVSQYLDPDGDAIDRNGNTYKATIIVTDTSGGDSTCIGPVLIEDQSVVF